MSEPHADLACNHSQLERTELAPGLSAQLCQRCAGHWLEIDDLRRWTAKLPPSDAELALYGPSTGADDSLVAVHSAVTARGCLHCTRLMQRVRVAVQPDFRIDRCATCQMLWLDPGEWQALWQAGLASSLLERLGDAWQRKIQEEEMRQRREAGLRAKFGQETLDELARIRAWLQTQPLREELITLLRSGL